MFSSETSCCLVSRVGDIQKHSFAICSIYFASKPTIWFLIITEFYSLYSAMQLCTFVLNY